MDTIKKAEMLAELYLREHDFTDLTPSELADKYAEVYKEILDHLQADAPHKKQRISY